MLPVAKNLGLSIPDFKEKYVNPSSRCFGIAAELKTQKRLPKAFLYDGQPRFGRIKLEK